MNTDKNIVRAGNDTSETQHACIVNTEYEKLAVAIRHENQTLALQRGQQRHVIRAIVSVYYVARTELHMPDRPFTPKEFHLIRKHLKKTAEQVIADSLKADSLKSERHWWQFATRRKDHAAAWRFYLQHDYFPPYKVPGLSDWKEDARYLCCPIFGYSFWKDFPLPLDYSKPCFKKNILLPSNFQELEAALTGELLEEWADASRPTRAQYSTQNNVEH